MPKIYANLVLSSNLCWFELQLNTPFEDHLKKNTPFLKICNKELKNKDARWNYPLESRAQTGDRDGAWVKMTPNPSDWLTASLALGKSCSRLCTAPTAPSLAARCPAELCLPTPTHPSPAAPAWDLLRFSQREWSQHAGGILPHCLQQPRLANTDNAATDQILIQSRLSVQFEARRHFPHAHYWRQNGSVRTVFHYVGKVTPYASNRKHVIKVTHLKVRVLLQTPTHVFALKQVHLGGKNKSNFLFHYLISLFTSHSLISF